MQCLQQEIVDAFVTILRYWYTLRGKYVFCVIFISMLENEWKPSEYIWYIYFATELGWSVMWCKTKKKNGFPLLNNNNGRRQLHEILVKRRSQWCSFYLLHKIEFFFFFGLQLLIELFNDTRFLCFNAECWLIIP